MLWLWIAESVACSVQYIVDSVAAGSEFQACLDALQRSEMAEQLPCYLAYGAAEALARLDYASCVSYL